MLREIKWFFQGYVANDNVAETSARLFSFSNSVFGLPIFVLHHFETLQQLYYVVFLKSAFTQLDKIFLITRII